MVFQEMMMWVVGLINEGTPWQQTRRLRNGVLSLVILPVYVLSFTSVCLRSLFSLFCVQL